MAPAYLPLQLPRLVIGLDPKLTSECVDAALILVDRRRAIPSETVEPHEAPMRAFPRRVGAQGEGRVSHPGFHVPVRLEVGHEAIDYLQINLLQTLTLGKAPLLVPALEE